MRSARTLLGAIHKLRHMLGGVERVDEVRYCITREFSKYKILLTSFLLKHDISLHAEGVKESH